MIIFSKIYAWFFLLLVADNAGQFFDKTSELEIYYHTTMVFSNWFAFFYFFNILNAIIYAVVSLYIFGYAYNIKGITHLPAYFLVIRLISDSCGHTYEFKALQSSFGQSQLTGLIGLACLVVLILPSYLIQWRMTFRKSS